jgi:hypothetical protein
MCTVVMMVMVGFSAGGLVGAGSGWWVGWIRLMVLRGGLPGGFGRHCPGNLKIVDQFYGH